MDEVIGIKSIREPLLFIIIGGLFTIASVIAIISFISNNGFVIPIFLMLCVGIAFASTIAIYGVKLLKRPKNLIILTSSTLLLVEEKKEILLADIAFAEVYYRNPLKSDRRGNINGVQIKTKEGSVYHIPQILDPIYTVKAINQRLK